MNLQASSRKLLRRPVRADRNDNLSAGIEPLESRIAPATLVSPTTVTFQDKTGDNVTVTISKPLFTTANVAKVFTFDTGSVNGDNSSGQQLELLNITKLGGAASGMDISITATPVNSSPGIVNVGYINASRIDLGDVTVGGDLGRINAGDLRLSSLALHSLTVNSIGVQGLATQAPNGNLSSNIAGGVGSITVNGDINGASIGIGGGARGTLASLTVTGSIIGGSTPYSGSVRTQGAVTNVLVDGSITGGSGANTGLIGTASSLGAVHVDGDLTGGEGAFSGAILSTKSMLSITIGGNIIGGGGAGSGQVGTAGTLSSISVGGSVTGGAGSSSGDILATGNITYAEMNGSLVGGSGAGSGEIGSASSIGTVFIEGSMTGGAGIHAFQNISSISVNIGTPVSPGVRILSAIHSLDTSLNPAPGPGIVNSFISADKGSIGSIVAGGSAGAGNDFAICNATISAGGVITTIDAFDPSDVAITGSHFSAGSITNLDATSDTGTAISGSQFHATQTIGDIVANGTYEAITNSTFRAAEGIASVTANAPDSGYGDYAIDSSGFDTGGNIGPINTTGPIYGSVFVAGIDLGSDFAVTGAGSFNNTVAAGIGFGSVQSNVGATIGAITVAGGVGNIPAFIESSTFLAGVHGAGADHTFGTKDDSVAVGSNIGAITAPSGLNNVFVESGNIGATVSGEIANTEYLATDTSVTSGGIGPITVNAQVLGGGFLFTHRAVVAALDGISNDTSHGIFNSTFTSNAGIGPVNVTLSGERTIRENAGISGSTFLAGHALGDITVNNADSGPYGSNYGIINSTFNGGIDGYGGTGSINVTLSDTGTEGNSAAISGLQINASVCSCMSANMGSISAENDSTGPGAAGIVDSVFRVHGNIGPISAITYSTDTVAAGIEGATFSAFGSIGDINVYGSVIGDTNGPSRFLAGYDIGSDMTFGNEDLGSKSLALQGGQSVGNVTVTGYFEGSDIAASVNPGAGHVFGDSTPGSSAGNDTNIGAGGSIGYVTIGANMTADSSPLTFDYATSHAIEAATFPSSDTPPVSAFGYSSYVPVVLYVDGGSNDVRITDLSQNVDLAG